MCNKHNLDQVTRLRAGGTYRAVNNLRKVKIHPQLIPRRGAGPFTSNAARPLICPNATGGAIDPSSFVDANGTRYVVFKNNGNAVRFARVDISRSVILSVVGAPTLRRGWKFSRHQSSATRQVSWARSVASQCRRALLPASHVSFAV